MMKGCKKIICSILSIVCIVGVFSVFISPSVSADAKDTTTFKKAMLQGVYMCLSNGHLMSSIDPNAITSYDSLVSSNSYTVALPTGYTTNNNKIDCATLFKTYVLPSAGVEIPNGTSSLDVRTNYLKELGFVPKSNDASECYRLQFYNNDKENAKKKEEDKDKAQTEAICWNSDGTISLNSNGRTGGTFADYRFEMDGKKSVKFVYPTTKEGDPGHTKSYESSGDHFAYMEQFVTDIFNSTNETGELSYVKTIYDPSTNKYVNQTTSYVLPGTNDKSIVNASNNDYRQIVYSSCQQYVGNVKDSVNCYAMNVAQNLGKKMGININTYDDIAFAEDEMFVTYQTALEQFWKVEKTCNENEFASHTSDNGWVDTALHEGDEVKKCKVKVTNNGGDKAWGFTQYNHFSSNTNNQKTFEEVCKWLLDHANIDVGDVASDLDQLPSGDDGDSGETPEDKDICFNESGALGWVVCPVITAVGSVMETAYESWIEPLLQVNEGVLSALNVDDSEHGIYSAWGIFRDIANVVFVIMLLLVIFSQVTGFGIDNYGIKRLLPRLIVTAIIVNFSFIICQLAVDISDIVGASIKDFLESFANQIQLTSAGGASGTVKGLFSFLVIGFTTFAIFSSGLVSGYALILPILMGLLTGLIGVLTGFIVLGARQALIVIMVVISPLAFILNMLPNTSPLFTRYRKMFINLLLVYPAAGLLIGGGYMAARLVLSVDENSFAMQLVGLLLLVIPYFFIIPLVRSSMSAFGNVGNTISNFGRSMSRGATGRIAGSETYKRLNTQLRAEGMEKRFEKAGKRNRFIGKTIGRFGAPGRAVAGAMTASTTMDLARRAEAADKQEQADIAAEAIMDARVNPADDDTTLRNRFLQAQDNRERSVIAQRWEKANRKGFVDNIANMAVANELDAGWAKTYFQNNKDANNMLDKRNPWAFNYVATGGAGGALLVNKKDENGNDVPGEVEISKAYKKGLQLNDMTGLSTDAINLGVSTNEIDSKLAYDTMTSTAPNIQSTIQSDPDKAPVLRMSADAYVPGTNVSGVNIAKDEKAREAASMRVVNGRATINAAKQGRAVTALTFGTGENVSGQSSEALKGIAPEIEGFNAVAAYKEKGAGGRLVLTNKEGTIGWDATNGKELSGAALQAAISNAGGKPISEATGTGNNAGTQSAGNSTQGTPAQGARTQA